MRHIVKGTSPAVFEDWKAKSNAEWQATYGDLHNPEKRGLHEALLNEQGHCCCYCGREISLADSHIEHFRPQEQRADLALHYENLMASCIRETRPGAPFHCGHAKGSAFDEYLHISPLEPSCERRFSYTLMGAISPVQPGDQQAAYMRDLLKLDLAFLDNRRGAVLQHVFDNDFLISVTNEELEQLVTAYGQNSLGTPRESFSHVVMRFAEQLLGRAV